MFKISDYLKDFDKQSNRGKCRACRKRVLWSKERLSGHKRASCPAISEEEKRKFSKISIENINNIISIDKVQSKVENQILTEEQKQSIHTKLAKFFFRTGISLCLADSEAFKDFLQSLNPLYAEIMINSKVLSELECSEINDPGSNGRLSDTDDAYFDGEMIEDNGISGNNFVRQNSLEKDLNQHQEVS